MFAKFIWIGRYTLFYGKCTVLKSLREEIYFLRDFKLVLNITMPDW